MLRNVLRMAEQTTKRLKPDPPIIGTHSGTFHADEALAVYLLRTLPAYSSSPLLRSRDPAQLAGCGVVVDVGGEYDPARHRYDHHQRGFSTTYPKHATTLSSAGLVWLHFGRAVVAQRTGLPEAHPDVALVQEKLYDDFLEAVDANDNGIDVYDPKQLPEGAAPRFRDRGFTLASVVSDLNHASDLPTPGAVIGQATGGGEGGGAGAVAAASVATEPTQQAEDARFAQASAFMGAVFMRKLDDAFHAWLPGRAVVGAAYRDRFNLHASGHVMALPATTSGGIPWKSHLYSFEREEEAAAAQQVFFVLYAESGEPDAKWRVQAVPVSEGSFVSRQPLKEEWRGVRDEELSKLSGIDGCVFVHASGFIGGNKTREGALQMAIQSLPSA